MPGSLVTRALDRNPLYRLSRTLMDFWDFGTDDIARHEVVRLCPKYADFVTVEDVNLDCPADLSHSKYGCFVDQLTELLRQQVVDRHEFNYALYWFQIK